MNVSLRDWLGNGWLVKHQTSGQEIRGLLGVADRDLVDCEASGLSPDWRLNIAYNAALQVATAALAASGYRAARDSHHYRIIESLAYTLRADYQLITQFDKFRKKRNLAEYELAGRVSEQEANEMVGLAKTLRTAVKDWLRQNHPGLLKGKE